MPQPTQQGRSCRDAASFDDFVDGTSPAQLLETCVSMCDADPTCNYLSFWQPLTGSPGTKAWCRLTATCDDFWPSDVPYDIYVIPMTCLLYTSPSPRDS